MRMLGSTAILLAMICLSAMQASCARRSAGAETRPDGPFVDAVIAQLPKGSLICTVARRTLCDDGDCNPAPPLTWATVNFVDDEYASCDRSHCNMESLPKGSLSKGRYATAVGDRIGNDGWLASFEPNGRFEEIRMDGLTVVSSGTCRRKD